MQNISWLKEVLKRKDDLINDLQGLLQIKSVLNEENATGEAPFGNGIKEALQYVLSLGEQAGFETKNIDNMAGHIEIGRGKNLIGVLCHIDVVPEGDGWEVDPYGGIVKDGKIYARGAIDDKGPTIAAYYAMKIVKELGLPLKSRVRLVIGTDEENDWRCVDHYFKHEEMPLLGFAPDADFPIIYAEKGIADFDLIFPPKGSDGEEEDDALLSFEAGRAYNMVPDFAKAILSMNTEQTDMIQRFAFFLKDHDYDGCCFVDDGYFVFELHGVSAHGSEPGKGINAGLQLIRFLAKLDLNKQSSAFIQFAQKYLLENTDGKAFGIDYQDDITGKLTINVGKIAYQVKDGGRFGINLRYPVTFDFEEGKKKIAEIIREKNGSLQVIYESPPHHVNKNDVMIQTLQKVYEEQTGEKAELLSIGGGTYARALQSGVAFGPLFPGRPDVAHQKNEYIFIDDLLKATALYAQAIYELATLEDHILENK